MADLFCSFLDFRSLTTNSNLQVFLPSKHYYSSAFFLSHNSRISGTRRRPLHLTLLSRPSSSPDFDIISTHEHPDGSFLFRFGDPSEVAKNVELEESKTVKKEKERENEDGLIKVLDKDHETEGLLQKADEEVTSLDSTEVPDPTNSVVVSSKSITVDEGEIEDSFEKLLVGSSDIESPVLTSSGEMEVTSIPGVQVEHDGNVEEVVKEEYEDSSAANDTPILDKSSEMGNNVITKESPDVATVVSLVSDSKPVIALPDDDVGHASEKYVVTTDVSPDLEHQNMETEIKDEGREDVRGSVESLLVSPPPQSQPAITSSKGIEDQNLQAGMQNLIIGEDSESGMNDHVAIGMQNMIVDNGSVSDMNDAEAQFEKAAIGAEAQASAPGTGMLNEIVEYESEHNMVQLTTVSPRLEAEAMLIKESVTDDMEESREDDGAENLKELNSTPQNLIVESESTEVDEDVQRGDLVEASVHEVTELKSTESITKSEETVTTGFVLSSGAALLPHPSKALTGGEDAYFIAGRTWLGVADGVGQWSLEGTKPGVYAQGLIKNCEKLISDCNGNSVNNPLELLNLSVAGTQLHGSSTVLVAQFDGQALHVANVGDSGFIVLRNGAVYKRSSPMLHVFHFPLQIERGDDPSSLAELYRIDLEENDVIITATDGLLDNLYDQEISSIVVKSLAADKKPKEIAGLLATTAQEIGSSRSMRSPFADDAQAAGFVRYSGGKLDDVAVIVSLVQTQQSNSQTS